MPCAESILVKETKVGKNIMACAKMIGITPALFTLTGKN
jgi:hypothetical protein